ncbi:MAG: ATP-binding protein [Gaiellaceae bacterium]
MSELPTGTVTFLFTDIEGSTKLLHELGDAYPGALAEHRRVLREAFGEHGGVEVDTQGDAFFVAFARARDALGAAAQAQRALDGGRIKVRVGLHTGEPLVTEEGYVGIDVHRAARIAAAGHGGQVLISQSTRDLVGPDELRDLGRHRLKDLTAPERIYQLGDGSFPPLKTLDRTNLPVASSPLVGRQAELTALLDSLRGDSRLVTITGAGGSGKTRLALQVAAELTDEFADGVFFVSLGPVQDATLVGSTIAQAAGVRALVDLHELDVLLALDNLEHVLSAADDLSSLLAASAGVKLLATSRARLNISAEVEYPLEPLRDHEAVEFFAERARTVKRDLREDETVAEICRRLDGLPLALELAASRVKVLDPPLLLERLDQRLPILTGGGRDVPERQQTLRATIEWSYRLLDERLQAAFRQVAVFAGSLSLDAAEQVAQVELEDVTALVDWSLLKPIGQGRFLMLETIREFALEQLAGTADAETVRRRHAEFFLELAERDEDDPRPQEAWLDLVEADHDNLRSAIAWARERGEARLELRMAAALAAFWEARSYLQEGLGHVREALARDPDAAVGLQAKALRSGVLLAIKQGDTATAREMAERMTALAEESGGDDILSEALNQLGMSLTAEQRFEEARTMLERALAISERLDRKPRVQSCLHNLGLVSVGERAFDQAVDELTAALELSRALADERSASNDQCDRAFALIGLARWREAGADALESLRVADRLGWPENVAYSFLALVPVAVAGNELEHAARLLGQADRLREELHLEFEDYSEETRIGAHEALEARLPRDRLDSLLAEGRALLVEDAVAEALGVSLD